ncbi:MAG TPA: LLM class F420-dependent oxidoreductase [Actinomycetota bacterium]
MRIGIHLRHWEGTPRDLVPLAREAEALGLDSVWMSETWGSDAMVLATWVAAHTERIGVGVGVAQMPARTPANAAMGTITIDHLSGGRFRLGLGTSGPQVAEGWHGTVFDHPLERTREYVDIVRAIVAREAPVAYEGRRYRLPATGGTGAGKPLKTNVRPLRSAVPIYLASMGPRNVALTAEIADGWMPLLYSPEHAGVFAGSLREGSVSRDPKLGALDVAPMAWVAIGDDLDACRDTIRSLMSLYVGAFGSRETNFYYALVARCGYEAEAARIQELALAGKRTEAAAAVPDRLVDEFALIGPVPRVAERLQAYRDAGVTTLLVQTTDVDTIGAIASAIERGGVS